MKTILLVDDDQDARRIYREALAQRGYRVSLATPGAEGVTVARQHRPDLILLDIRMPVMDGFTALEYLKTDERTVRIPVWGISAYLSEEKGREPGPRGFSRVIPKPLSPNELVAEVDIFFGTAAPPIPNGTLWP